jgi:hypothetical protein
MLQALIGLPELLGHLHHLALLLLEELGEMGVARHEDLRRVALANGDPNALAMLSREYGSVRDTSLRDFPHASSPTELQGSAPYSKADVLTFVSDTRLGRCTMRRCGSLDKRRLLRQKVLKLNLLVRCRVLRS